MYVSANSLRIAKLGERLSEHWISFYWLLGRRGR